MTREVLQRADDAPALLRPDHGSSMAHDLVRIGREAAFETTDDRVVGAAVEINDGGEVEVQAVVRQRLGDGVGRALGLRRIIALAERLGGDGVWKAITRLQARDSPTFLVDIDEQ